MADITHESIEERLSELRSLQRAAEATAAAPFVKERESLVEACGGLGHRFTVECWSIVHAVTLRHCEVCDAPGPVIERKSKEIKVKLRIDNSMAGLKEIARTPHADAVKYTADQVETLDAITANSADVLKALEQIDAQLAGRQPTERDLLVAILAQLEKVNRRMQADAECAATAQRVPV